jgi:hypothetical protein
MTIPDLKEQGHIKNYQTIMLLLMGKFPPTNVKMNSVFPFYLLIKSNVCYHVMYHFIFVAFVSIIYYYI